MTVGMFPDAVQALEHHRGICAPCRLDVLGGCKVGDRLRFLVEDMADEQLGLVGVVSHFGPCDDPLDGGSL